MDNSTQLYGHCELDDLGVLTLRGRDALAFLQGQLSQDVNGLAEEQALFAGCHTPQGRVIAILRLLPAGEGAHCVLPRELVEPLAARLRRYILRAKVSVADDSGALRVIGIAAGGTRTLQVAAAGTEVPSIAAAGSTLIARDTWRALDIADGLPQVYRATSETFIAQMLNLDCVGGIAFDKGCYTGQEIIARAHYRGRVKRRMQRFRTAATPGEPLAPGSTGRLADGRAYEVVDAVALADGRVEFLAIAPLAAAGGAPADEPPVPAAPRALSPPLEAQPLPLPYALPH
jgi:folate-binding protein YgfZ